MKRWLYFSLMAHFGFFSALGLATYLLKPQFLRPVLTVQLVSAPPRVESRSPLKASVKQDPEPVKQKRKPQDKPKIEELASKKPIPKPVAKAVPKPEDPAPKPQDPVVASIVPPRPPAPPGPSVEVAVRDPDFKFPFYYALLQRKLNGTWDPPPLQYGNPVIHVVILFSLGRDGSLRAEPRIEESSGNTYFDQAALRAVLRAAPFPPFPEGFYGDQLIVHYRFQYNVGG